MHPNEVTAMSAEDLAVVLLKVTGIYWLVEAVLTIPTLVALRGVPQHSELPDAQLVLALQVCAVLVYSSLGATFLLATRKVVSLMRLDHHGAPSNLDSRTIQAVGLSLLGVWFIASSLPELLQFLGGLLPLLKFGRAVERANYWQQTRSTLLQPAVELATGLALFTGSRGLSSFWHSLRPLTARPDQ
jgi:hypothetical protein